MTRDVKALAVCKDEFPPRIVIPIIDIKDYRNVVFDVGYFIGALMRCRRSSHLEGCLRRVKEEKESKSYAREALEWGL